MSILLRVGNPGSGKTAYTVMEMVENNLNQNYYTDIESTKPKLTPHIKILTKNMLVKSELKKTIKHHGGEVENVYNYSLNEDFWKERREERKSVVIDECHKYLDARQSFSQTNRLFNDFLALTRRIVDTNQHKGDMIFITQLGKRADVVLREMANEVQYFIGHCVATCKRCGCSIYEDTEMPDFIRMKHGCRNCGHWDIKYDYPMGRSIEIIYFKSTQDYATWVMFGKPMCGYQFRGYYRGDISKYFKFYDTYQWNNMFSKT